MAIGLRSWGVGAPELGSVRRCPPCRRRAKRELNSLELKGEARSVVGAFPARPIVVVHDHRQIVFVLSGFRMERDIEDNYVAQLLNRVGHTPEECGHIPLPESSRIGLREMEDWRRQRSLSCPWRVLMNQEPPHDQNRLSSLLCRLRRFRAYFSACLSFSLALLNAARS